MIKKLRHSVELRFGKKISYQKDCKDLSDSIIKHTGERISSSTLRRFFGFLQTNSNPALVTLDILSVYCGYKNWNDFQISISPSDINQQPIIDLWHRVYEKSKSISLQFCEQVKRNTPIGYNCTANRDFASDRISNFLNSQYAATPFIGPGGYGKTTLLINWYEKSLKCTKNQNDIVLFAPAVAVESGLGKDHMLEKWIQYYLNIEIETAIFNSLSLNPDIIPGKFILIIDALDEVSLLGYKSDRVFGAIHQFISKYSNNSWIKLIVSSRFPTWESFFSTGSNPNLWYFASRSSFSSEVANIPPLNDDEIQEALDNTINNLLPERLLVEEFTFDMLQILSYPYFLQIFIEIFKPELSSQLNDRLDLLSEFMQKRISSGAYSDEKIDIINKIIELSNNGVDGSSIKKNSLKEIYPIHLKFAGNYYSAYNDLLSYGIVFEDVIEKYPGVFIKYVRIPQGNLGYLLILQKLIAEKGGISFELFKNIQELFANSQHLPYLISLLFEMSYKDHNIDALSSFFSLNEDTIKNALKLPSIALCLRRDDYMRRELIPKYATNKLARKYLFESAVDINSITKSYKYTLEAYNKASDNAKSTFFANTLITLSNYLSLEIKDENNPVDILSFSNPPAGISPFVAGLWFSVMIINDYYHNKSQYPTIIKQTNEYIQVHPESTNFEVKADFELGLAIGIIISKRYSDGLQRLDYISNRIENEDFSSTEKALYIHLEFFRWRTTSVFNHQVMNRVKGYIRELPIWNSYYTLILAKAWLALHLINSGNLPKALEMYQKAVEISNLSGYLVYEVKLLKNLIPILEKLGESNRAIECKSLAMSIIDKTGVDFNLF